MFCCWLNVFTVSSDVCTVAMTLDINSIFISIYCSTFTNSYFLRWKFKSRKHFNKLIRSTSFHDGCFFLLLIKSNRIIYARKNKFKWRNILETEVSISQPKVSEITLLLTCTRTFQKFRKKMNNFAFIYLLLVATVSRKTFNLISWLYSIDSHKRSNQIEF